MRKWLVTFAVLTVTHVGAAHAAAATVARSGNAIGFTAVAGDKVDLAVRAGNSSIRSLVFANATGATGLTIGAGCSGTAIQAACLIVQAGVQAQELRFVTAGGADRINAANTFAPFDASLPEDFATGDGDDVLTAGPLADAVRAGAGADTITGGPGADELFGEGGDDTFEGIDGADRIDGGPGVDLLDLSDAAAGVAVSLNGAADDGPLGTDADADVENVRGSSFRDLLTGGPGPNELQGGDGDDLIDARDGGDDVVNCGAGADDRAIVDGSDTVSGCEAVELPPPPPPPPDAGAGGPDPVTSPDGGAATPVERAGPRLIAARLAFGWLGFRDGTQADRLVVRELPAGGAAQLLCSGAGCPTRRRTAKATPAGRANLLRFLGRRRLPAGVVVEVRMTAPGFVGKVVRFTMRSRGRQPRRASLCLPPGAAKPSRCAA